MSHELCHRGFYVLNMEESPLNLMEIRPCEINEAEIRDRISNWILDLDMNVSQSLHYCLNLFLLTTVCFIYFLIICLCLPGNGSWLNLTTVAHQCRILKYLVLLSLGCTNESFHFFCTLKSINQSIIESMLLSSGCGWQEFPRTCLLQGIFASATSKTR